MERASTPNGDGSDSFVCYGRTDYSPFPARRSHTLSDTCQGLTSPRTPPPAASPSVPRGFPVMTFPYSSSSAVGGPVSSLQTPVRPDTELDYQKRLAEVIKSVNDAHRSDPNPSPPITQLCDYLFVGGVPNDEMVPILKKSGITHVINVVEAQYRTCNGVKENFKHLGLDTYDSPDYYILDYHYESFRHWVDEVRHAGGKVFVHCYAGINRSVALCAAYLMDYYLWDLIEIVRHIRTRGRNLILDNAGFQQQLVDFYLNFVKPRADLCIPAAASELLHGHQ